MRLRKFYLVVSLIILVILFCFGALIIGSIKSNGSSDNPYFGSGFLSALGLDNISGTKINKPANCLFMVGDKSSANTDTMMLINYNPETKKVSLLTIPRDTKCTVKGSKVKKINSAMAVGGPENAVDAVSNLLDTRVDYYFYMNLSAFREIIDTLDGVDFNVPVDMKYDDPYQDLHIDLKQGFQHLDGAKAEQLLRFRKYNKGVKVKNKGNYYGGDEARTQTQRDFIRELVRQKANIKYVSKIPEVLKTVSKNTKTDIPWDLIKSMSMDIAAIKAEDIEAMSLPGEDVEQELWYFIYDEKKGKEIIEKYFSVS